MFRITTKILGALLVSGALVACGDDGSATSNDGGNGQGGTANGGNPSDGGGGTTSGTADVDQDGFTVNDGDCNDNDAAVNPNAVEVCADDIDNNCNGATDENEPDKDGDGFGPCNGDCNDNDLSVSPVATEVAGDGIDNNCDGTIDADFDSDGVTSEDGDCNDNDATVHPGAPELCFDGVDNDCDGFSDAAEPDEDGDTYGPCEGDCDDTNADVNPSETEIDGDGIDNDCDNLIDHDVDGDGWTIVNGDCNDNDAAINPAAIEDCDDGIDNDCNGETDIDCLTPCELADLLRSSVGCVYYAYDANNDPFENYDTLPYSVAVSNVDAVATALVQVQVRSGGVWNTIDSAMVAPGTLRQFALPDRHINYTGVNTAGAYRVVSDLPVIAYQFQPIDGVNSYTSDASLLLPASSLDRFYYVAGWGKPSFGNPQLVVVGSQDNTVVSITPSTATQAGGSVPAITAGSTYQVTLNEGDYIQLEAPANSFTGSYVTADKPIGVFSANWCANIPTQVCCCDHLEEQLYGVQTWGMTYVASRLPVRSSGTPEVTVWDVVASENNTTVNFQRNPAVTGLPAGPQVLNAGQSLRLQVSGTAANPGDFIVTSDKPILLMEYMTSSQTTNAPVNLAGDPAMTLSVPAEQYLDHYVVLVPVNWTYDYMVLTKPIGSTLTLDGATVNQASFIPINDGVNTPVWEVARIAVPDGVHTLDGSAPFGVLVIGYDAYDSYAYPGGLNQEIINPIN